MTETTQHLARLEALTVFAESTTERRYVTHYMTPGDAAALAHAVKLLRAEEVQLRRGWGTHKVDDGRWTVMHYNLAHPGIAYAVADTPADALLAADEWVREQEQMKGA